MDDYMNFSIREDEGSVQYPLASHPRFWVRVVKPFGQTLAISDALSGSLSPRDMGRAFAAIFNNHADNGTNVLTVADLAPDLPAGRTEQRQFADRFDQLDTRNNRSNGSVF